eukprot:gene5497-6849_t
MFLFYIGIDHLLQVGLEIGDDVVSVELSIENSECLSIFRNSTSLEVLTLIIRPKDNAPIRIPPGAIPNSVKTLELHYQADFRDEEVKDVGYLYESVLVNGSIPSSVVYLSISHMLFKHDLSLIPESVTVLNVLNWSYTPGCRIPSSVRYLRFSGRDHENMTQLEPGVIPESIITLELGRFKTCVGLARNVVPKSCRLLNLGNYRLLDIDSIPEGVEELIFAKDYSHPLLPNGHIPNGVKTIINFNNRFSNSPCVIPSTVKNLRMSLGANPVLEVNESIIPSTLENLITSEVISNCKNTIIPPSIETLQCGFQEIKIGLLPPKLKIIVISSKVQSIEVGSLPTFVRKINI